MPDERIPEVGDLVSDFEALDSTGQLRRLSELLVEKPAVLIFYRGHW